MTNIEINNLEQEFINTDINKWHLTDNTFGIYSYCDVDLSINLRLVTIDSDLIGFITNNGNTYVLSFNLIIAMGYFELANFIQNIINKHK